MDSSKFLSLLLVFNSDIISFSFVFLLPCLRTQFGRDGRLFLILLLVATSGHFVILDSGEERAEGTVRVDS